MKYFLALSAVFTVVVGFAIKPIHNGERIVGGRPADISEFPHTVSVRVWDQHICGGSIIDETTILTAAHCVEKYELKDFSIRVGNTYNKDGTQYFIKEIRQNENYDPKLVDNDMAILKLKEPLVFSNTVQAIKLQPRGVHIPGGQFAFVSGWGRLQENGTASPSLRAVDVAVMDTKDCRMKLSGITNHELCAINDGKDSCQGDSGGPLISGGRLIGVVSWGIGCAKPGFPGVYAKCSNEELSDWITKNRI